jgi:hypothetical protein
MSKKNRVQIFLSEENLAVFKEYKKELEGRVMSKVSDTQVGNFMIACLVSESKKGSLQGLSKTALP